MRHKPEQNPVAPIVQLPEREEPRFVPKKAERTSPTQERGPSTPAGHPWAPGRAPPRPQAQAEPPHAGRDVKTMGEVRGEANHPADEFQPTSPSRTRLPESRAEAERARSAPPGRRESPARRRAPERAGEPLPARPPSLTTPYRREGARPRFPHARWKEKCSSSPASGTSSGGSSRRRPPYLTAGASC